MQAIIKWLVTITIHEKGLTSGANHTCESVPTLAGQAAMTAAEELKRVSVDEVTTLCVFGVVTTAKAMSTHCIVREAFQHPVKHTLVQHSAA